MEKVRIKDLIEFRKKKDGPRRTLVNNLKKVKKKKESGGDYWITSLSAISNSFKYNDTKFLQKKIDDLLGKVSATTNSRTKGQYQKNIDILIGFKDFDLDQIRPDVELKFHKKPTNKSIININGIPVQAWPHHVFSFSVDKSNEIGAVWFVNKLDGFDKNELGMFADIMYRYLNVHYSENFYVNPEYCIAIDVGNGQETSYKDILDGNIPILIDRIIEELKVM